MSDKINEDTNVNSEKRKFMVKAGKYAVVGAGMATLMTPSISTANTYHVYECTEYNKCEDT